MSSRLEQETLAEIAKLPDIKLDEQRKKEMLAMIANEEAKYRKQTHSRRQLALVGKGLAACVVLIGGVWFGTHLFDSGSNQSALPPTQTNVQETPGTGTPGTPDNASGTATTPGERESHQALLKNIMELARQGKVSITEYALESAVFDDIETALGKPDSSTYTNGLTYAGYDQRGLVFGYNKGMQVVELRSFDSKLNAVSQSEVIQAYGQPEVINKFVDQDIYQYKINDKYQLKVVFTAPTLAVPEPHIDHINVVYPRGAENLMAYGNGADLLQVALDLAREGKAIGSEYPVEHSVFDTIEANWGKADKTDYVNGLTYATYDKQGIVFGFNKGMQIVEIRSYDQRLQALTLADVKAKLGKPGSVNTTSSETIYVYKATDKYQLKIVFPTPTKAQPTPHIDHVNLLYPQGTINNMAG